MTLGEFLPIFQAANIETFFLTSGLAINVDDDDVCYKKDISCVIVGEEKGHATVIPLSSILALEVDFTPLTNPDAIE